MLTYRTPIRFTFRLSMDHYKSRFSKFQPFLLGVIITLTIIVAHGEMYLVSAYPFLVLYVCTNPSNFCNLNNSLAIRCYKPKHSPISLRRENNEKELKGDRKLSQGNKFSQPRGKFQLISGGEPVSHSVGNTRLHAQ